MNLAVSNMTYIAIEASPDTISQAHQAISLYCRHECFTKRTHLSRPTDQHCPNQTFHDSQDIDKSALARLFEDQLSSSSFAHNGLTPLGKAGRSGVLYKVHIYQSGHVLVAKGFQSSDFQWLQNEAAVYARLEDFQGHHLPVCCGVVHLQEPLDEAGGRTIQHLLLLSWAGEALSSWTIYSEATEPQEARLKPRLVSALRQIHDMQVVHGDTVRRNFMFDESTQRFMLIDFERSRLYSGRPPCDPARPCRKRCRDKNGRLRLCMYCREISIAGENLSYESPRISPVIDAMPETRGSTQHQSHIRSSPNSHPAPIPRARKRGKPPSTQDEADCGVKTHSMALRRHELGNLKAPPYRVLRRIQ